MTADLAKSSRQLKTANLAEQYLSKFMIPSAAVSTVNNVYSDFTIDKEVVPGEPIPVSIWFWSFDRSLDFGVGCVIKFFYAKKEIFRIPNDGTSLSYVSNPDPKAMDLGDLHVLIDPPPPTSAVGKSIFAIGDHELEMEISTVGGRAGKFTSTNILTVVPESVDQFWWVWADPHFSAGGVFTPEILYTWKNEYSLAGYCANLSTANIAMNYSVTLDETDYDDGSTKSFETISTRVPTNQATSPPLEFQPIKQDWKWLEEAIWLIVGPLHKTYGYTAHIDLDDDYGNQYYFESAPRFLTVNVSEDKQKLAEAAAATGFTAIGLTIVSVFVGWLGIVAGASGTASQILGAEALDPPELDNRFLDIVKPEEYEMPKEFSKNKEIISIATFFKMLHEIVNAMHALEKIEGKMMGAKAAESREGIELQKKSYKLVIAQMVRKANKLSASADAASESIIGSGVFEIPELRRIISNRNEFSPSDLDSLLRKAKVNKRSWAVAETILSNSKFRRFLLSAKGISRLFRLASLPVIHTVFNLERASSQVLRKYRMPRTK